MEIELKSRLREILEQELNNYFYDDVSEEPPIFSLKESSDGILEKIIKMLELSKLALFKRVETKDENPVHYGWYNTDKGELFWMSDKDVWSCGRNKISEEYPKLWYKPMHL